VLQTVGCHGTLRAQASQGVLAACMCAGDRLHSTNFILSRVVGIGRCLCAWGSGCVADWLVRRLALFVMYGAGSTSARSA
jgi:hypothetical protein